MLSELLHTSVSPVAEITIFYYDNFIHYYLYCIPPSNANLCDQAITTIGANERMICDDHTFSSMCLSLLSLLLVASTLWSNNWKSRWNTKRPLQCCDYLTVGCRVRRETNYSLTTMKRSSLCQNDDCDVLFMRAACQSLASHYNHYHHRE